MAILATEPAATMELPEKKKKEKGPWTDRGGWKKSRRQQAGSEEPRINVGYLRVSTHVQAETGEGLAMQRAGIIAHAALNDETVDEWFCDTDSGSEEMREDLERLRQMIRDRRVKKLRVYKLDRLCRDMLLHSLIERECRESGTEIISINEAFGKGPMGIFFRQLMAALAQLERATIAMRLSDGKRTRMRARGHYGGGPGCLGFKSAGRVEMDEDGNMVRIAGHGQLEQIPEEIETVNIIYRLRREGYALQAIADYLNSVGRLTHRGGRWQAQTVAKVLARESFYAGESVLHFNMAPEPKTIAHECVLSSQERGGLPQWGRQGARLDTDGKELPKYHLRLPLDMPDSFRETIELARSLREEGMLPSHIAAKLNAEGHRSVYGSIFRTTAVVRLLARSEMIIAALDRRLAGDTSGVGTRRGHAPHDLHADEVRAIDEAKRLYETGDWSYRKIAIHLNETIPHPYNPLWYPANVRDMVLGRVRYKRAPQHSDTAEEWAEREKRAQEMILAMREADPQVSAPRIAAQVNEAGLLRANGKEWNPSSVYRALAGLLLDNVGEDGVSDTGETNGRFSPQHSETLRNVSAEEGQDAPQA